jgi:hypothetical protein
MATLKKVRMPARSISTLFLIVLSTLWPSSATASTICAQPGKQGAAVGVSGVLNTYFQGLVSIAPGSTSVSVSKGYGANSDITAGDMLLIIQMQDSLINSSNTDAYGDGVAGDPGAGASDEGSTGLYEYVVATNTVTYASGGTVTFSGEGGGFELFFNVGYRGTVECWGSNSVVEFFGCPTEVGFQNLTQVHTGDNTKRVEDNIYGSTIRQEWHVGLWQNGRDNTFVTVSAGHLVADGNFAQLSDGNFDLLIDTSWQLVAELFGENFDADNFTAFTMRQTKRSVFNVFGFFAENGAQKLFFRR